MIIFIIFHILFSFISLLAVGFWFYYITCITSWVREIKNELHSKNYFSAYFVFVAGLGVSTFIITGIPLVMYQIWGPFRQHVCNSVMNETECSEPPAKVIHYKVPQEVRIDSEFVHDNKVIHKESI